jgi:hypothetical protein
MKKNTIEKITKLSSKMPKTLNEALNFGPYEESHNDVDVQDTPEIQEPEEEVVPDMSEKARKLIDNIRKMSLKAMAELADSPQSPEYESLKKIWQLCDKAVNEKEEQREVMNKQNGLQ